jgi:hypothetical protein
MEFIDDEKVPLVVRFICRRIDSLWQKRGSTCCGSGSCG